MIVKSVFDDDLDIDWYSLCKERDRNYTMNIHKEYIEGVSSDIESMRQVIFKILNTEKNNYLIYTPEYGIDLSDLFGESINYVKGEVESRVKEALLKDNRITDVHSFAFESNKRGVLEANFIVDTKYGEVSESMEVRY